VKAFGKNFQTFVPMTTLFLKDQIQKETLEEKTRESSIEALTLIVEKG
jgi:dihydroorotase